MSPAPGAAARAQWRAWLLLLRPRQWTKNLAAYAPLLFSRSVFQGDRLLLATAAVAAFCLLASSGYVLNDWLDRERDRVHPEKSRRPLASGQVSPREALALGLLCLGGGLGLALWVGPAFTASAAAYLALQILYSTALKRWVVIDVMAIAVGFVVRVAGGGVAIDVPLSNWLYLCALLLALFLGFAKRRHELAVLKDDAQDHRASLSDYSLPMLDQMLSVVAAACILGYGLYSVSPETVAHVGSDRLKFTVPFVVYGIFRYLFLVHSRGAGGSPERILLSDLPLIADLALFLAVAGWVLYR